MQTMPDAQLQGFTRYASNDARFPVSFACPRGDGVYHSNDPVYLHLDIGAALINFAVTRLDLAPLARLGVPQARLASAVIQGTRNMVWFQQQSMEDRKNAPAELRTVLNVGSYQLFDKPGNMVTVGAGSASFKAPRIVFHDRQGHEGEWVFFTRNPGDVFATPPSNFGLWTIIRNPDPSHPKYASAFPAMLASWQWLA